MERSRTALLHNAFLKAEASGDAGIPTGLQETEKKILSHHSEIARQLSGEGITARVKDSLLQQFMEENNKFLALQEELRNVNPNYFLAKYESRSHSVDEVENMLSKMNAALVEYFWSEDKIFALLVSKGQRKLKVIPVTSEFNQALNGFIQECRFDPEGAYAAKRYNDFCFSAALLYDQLLKDLISDLKPGTRLIISTQGRLLSLPFEALITHAPESGEVDYHLPYLITERQVGYAFSASVLQKQLERRRDGKKLLALGYAGNGMSRNNRGGIANLPGTEKEIKSIKDVMKNDVNKYFLEGAASEATFKQQAQGFDIVHLAVHGEADTTSALNSRLIFRSELDTVEDGKLYAHELYELDLSKLDLAVLSSCESGIGKQQAGEGVMSIARGFAYAGCPSLVISLWKIDDKISAQVMGKFYEHLSQGEPIDQSLAKAKLDYLKNTMEFNSHPYYWAAFLPVGNPESLDVKKPNWWGWVLGLAMMIVLLCWLFYFKR